MKVINDILAYNAEFVARDGGAPFRTNQFPDKKLVVLTCMDTRLTELLPQAMAIRNGDVKLLKNAGAIVSHPFGSVMRSILVAVYELGAEEIAVVGHYGCGMAGLSCTRIIDKAKDRGVPPRVFDTLSHSGIDLRSWLAGFDSPETGVRQSVNTIRNHPLLPPNLPVHGMMIDPDSGKLELLIDGYATELK
ncbi:MAG TPA: carbonic anhydrase [Roseimicrobium sp.]|nr:carbonic anhydrase [Roseimicrobium sp.]